MTSGFLWLDDPLIYDRNPVRLTVSPGHFMFEGSFHTVSQNAWFLAHKKPRISQLRPDNQTIDSALEYGSIDDYVDFTYYSVHSINQKVIPRNDLSSILILHFISQISFSL